MVSLPVDFCATDAVNAPQRPRLGEILIARGKLDAAGVERALRLQQDTGQKFGTLLVTLGLCAQRDFCEALAAQLDLPLLDRRMSRPASTTVSANCPSGRSGH